MLDIRRIREDYEEVSQLLQLRGLNYDLKKIIDLDDQRKEILSVSEGLRHEQKVKSKEIPELKKQGKDASHIIEEMSKLSQKVKDMTSDVSEIEDKIYELLLEIPNTPDLSTPKGDSDEDNILIKTEGEPTTFDFDIKAHWDLGEDLDIIDFERAGKIAGARFSVMKNLGARLERSVLNFMLDLHTENHGYNEVIPPFMVNRDAMIGTGQLPKFENDMFHVPSKDMFLIPTAEVPLTNLYGGEILDEDMLPIYHTAYTPCFRKEAGSAGRDTRGLIRQHQFNKVELVKFSKPEDSEKELESLLLNAEEVLKQLKLPYRVVQLCGGDLGFSSAKTYDIEVWMPSYDDYLEISSCSNFRDYQARRANLRYRRADDNNVDYLHTLNGSGLAVGRTVAAIMENYQNADGSITVPEVLQPYMGGKKIIK
ncbi:MAG TPA: serine--tRNA ligase [Clostridia bacterium]|nr:serine--tRNA ligase [Clostridia bacterium]